MKFSQRLLGALAAMIALISTSASAQWKDQQIQLNPGWNAIHLDVDPAVDGVGPVFGSIPIQSVWYWNGKFSSVQFLADPEELLPEDPNWLAWFPAGTPQAAANRLFDLVGGGSYLVKLGGAQSHNLTIKGRPVIPRANWLTDNWAMVGFPIDPALSPTFASFFASSSAHQGPDTFQRLGADGIWQTVPATTEMRPGEAFWVRSKGGSNFQGPISVTGIAGGALDFGRLTAELSVNLHNHGSSAKPLSIRILNSATPPASAPGLAGEVPLSWVDFRVGIDPTYEPLSVNDTRSITVPAKGARSIRLAIRRDAMTPVADEANAFYQSILRVEDGAGAIIDLPIRALALNQFEDNFSPLVARSGRARTTVASPYCGLWVGTVTVDKVSLPANRTALERPERASNELRYRIIMHVDENGEPRLLKNVTVMAKTESQVTRLVLVTDDSKVDDFEGVFERDGSLLGQRISSVNFPFFNVTGHPRNTLPSDPGSIFEDGDGATTDTLHFSFTLQYDDPVNPFLHRFHPDHDAKDALFNPFPEGEVDITGDGNPDVRFSDINRQTNRDESYSIYRELEFQFSGEHPTLEQTPPQWLGTQLGGVFRERLYGLYRTDYTLTNSSGDPAPIATPLVVSGTFELVQVSTVAQLNDGM